MSDKRNVNSYFSGALENLDNILRNNFYKDEDKVTLRLVRKKIEDWYDNYNKKNTLSEIDFEDIKYIDLEITDFFDKYYVLESINDNYSERLSYDFSHLQKCWKDEILGGKKNDG